MPEKHASLLGGRIGQRPPAIGEGWPSCDKPLMQRRDLSLTSTVQWAAADLSIVRRGHFVGAQSVSCTHGSISGGYTEPNGRQRSDPIARSTGQQYPIMQSRSATDHTAAREVYGPRVYPRRRPAAIDMFAPRGDWHVSRAKLLLPLARYPTRGRRVAVNGSALRGSGSRYRLSGRRRGGCTSDSDPMLKWLRSWRASGGQP